jgi:hypothetical protein
MKDKYSEFRDLMNKTDARHYLDGLIKKYNVVKRQNVKILKRLALIVGNQNHYLQKVLPRRLTRNSYEKSRLKFLREFSAAKRKIDRLIGRVYVDDTRGGGPRYFLKLTRPQINKLLHILGDKNETR